MSPFWTVVVALLAGLPAVMAALATLIKQISDARTAAEERQAAAALIRKVAADQSVKIEEVHKTINSRMTEMLANVKAAGIAEGVKKEQLNPENRG